jgi:hypothetical protein
MNNKTFLNPQYTLKPKNPEQEDSLLPTENHNLNTQICGAEELKAVQNRAWQERIKLDCRMAASKS